MDIQQPLPVLVLTVGLPRSGKTTWAKAHIYPIVSPDAIRLAIHGQTFLASAEPLVWAVAKVMVASLFEYGHEFVIVDACNASSKRLKEWEDPRWRVEPCYITTSTEECKRRAENEGRTDLLPVIDRMAAEWDHEIPLKGN